MGGRGKVTLSLGGTPSLGLLPLGGVGVPVVERLLVYDTDTRVSNKANECTDVAVKKKKCALLFR